ncbi:MULTISPECIES: PAS domain-containing sensor histidine kinase [Undibacterium]|uniref:histidine kinase n=1 Tax=Undibacterium umbellatum TaxID=2762300 RepID=A0ABR6Z5E3_9BURK|nr:MULTISPECIES: PAS domain-containing sensor histidine kinase [Undibacterium]MBC3906990.1 PAS domain-containing sensor histidine kinase [Undibacterium umbellatum]MDP1976599.1 PAS domain-containing sensor histidine kinase [Undibacterium sp.]
MTDAGMPQSTSVLCNGLLRHIIDHSREAILVVDMQRMELVDANQLACMMLAYPRSELLGLPLANIECSLQDVFFWEALRADAQAEGHAIAESEWISRHGVSFPVEKRVTAFIGNGIDFFIIHAEDITHRRELVEGQVHLVAQLQSSLDATAEGILSIDLNGNVVNINQRFSSMWQLSDELLAARDEAQMFAHIKDALQEADSFFASLEKIHDDPNLETEDLMTLKDGRYFICVSKPEFMRDRRVGRVFSVRDITQMKEAEVSLVAARDAAEQASKEKSRMVEALMVSESRLRRLVNSSLIGIMQGNMSGVLTEANDVLLQLAGVQRLEFAEFGMSWLDRTTEESHAAHQNAMEELRSHGQARPYEGELIRKDGVRIPVMVGLAQLEGSFYEWVGFVLDLTEQRKADRIKSEFISVVSHELRTPLTSIRGALGLLESGVAGELTAKTMQLIKVAHKNCQRLGVLVNDILDMEKLASGKMVINIERFDLVAVTRQAIEANAGYAQALNVRYRIVDHPENAWAMGDNVRVMQVFANLLSNAAKFSPSGAEVQVRITDISGSYKIEVEDHGQGIPEAFREQIFKKFAQADGTNTRQQGGTGLGLNITKTFVEKMGGEIGFETEEGKGCTFWFTLLACAHRRHDR